MSFLLSESVAGKYLELFAHCAISSQDIKLLVDDLDSCSRMVHVEWAELITCYVSLARARCRG